MNPCFSVIISSSDPAGHGQDVPPRLLPLLRVQRVPGRRPLHRRLRQQDLLRQRLSQDLRAKVRRLRRGHHSRRGARLIMLNCNNSAPPAALRPSGSNLRPSGDMIFGPRAATFPVSQGRGCRISNIIMVGPILHKCQYGGAMSVQQN